MSRPRIAVFAYSELGHACLAHLIAAKENVVAVYTHTNSPGETIWFPSVENLTHEHGIPVFTSEVRELPPIKADLIFSFYYRNLIPLTLFSSAVLGAYNMHGSLLPKYRGRAPINWAVLNGETETGATLHVMAEKADAGDIVDQEKVTIGPDDTAGMVQQNVTAAAVRVLSRQLENLKAGRAPRRPQDAAQATYFGRRRPEDGEIDWAWPAARVHNLVRALTHPYPGAFGQLNGETYFVWKSRLVGPGEPASADKLILVCGDGQRIELQQIQRKNVRQGERV